MKAIGGVQKSRFALACANYEQRSVVGSHLSESTSTSYEQDGNSKYLPQNLRMREWRLPYHLESLPYISTGWKPKERDDSCRHRTLSTEPDDLRRKELETCTHEMKKSGRESPQGIHAVR